VPPRPIARLALRHLAALAGCLPAAACGGGWQAVPPPWPASFTSRQEVQVWAGHRTTRLHGVVVTPDSVSGIPFLQPLTCDSCRVQLARSEVDSLRVGDPTGGFWASSALVLVGLLVAAFTVCETGSLDCPSLLSGGT
jgi:hypothetical protein